jgi:hypothetical protein
VLQLHDPDPGAPVEVTWAAIADLGRRDLGALRGQLAAVAARHGVPA